MTPFSISPAVKQLRRALALIDWRLRRSLAFVLLVTIVVSILEIVSIVSVFPMFQLILDPDRLMRASWFQWMFGEVPLK